MIVVPDGCRSPEELERLALAQGTAAGLVDLLTSDQALEIVLKHQRIASRPGGACRCGWTEANSRAHTRHVLAELAMALTAPVADGGNDDCPGEIGHPHRSVEEARHDQSARRDG